MESREVLDNWTQSVGDCGPVRPMIAGHTDIGEADEVGDKRIRVVLAYLAAHGIPAEEISGQNFGHAIPRIRSLDGEAQGQNRRVEISAIYAQPTSEN